MPRSGRALPMRAPGHPMGSMMRAPLCRAVFGSAKPALWLAGLESNRCLVCRPAAGRGMSRHSISDLFPRQLILRRRFAQRTSRKQERLILSTCGHRSEQPRLATPSSSFSLRAGRRFSRIVRLEGARCCPKVRASSY
ncbi:hypothetical protein CGRA01v4_07475 [Colletotrichum graminicola]|nr:hypothetical protein CGRA01v4_07475 [Colletotrichum graminicola]